MRHISLRCLLMSGAILFLHASHGIAAVFHVHNTNVSGPGSLQQALVDVAAAPIEIHEVRFSPGFPQDGVIEYATEHLTLSTPVLVIDGMDRRPVLTRTNTPLVSLLVADATVIQLTLRNLTVRDVRAANAAACLGGGDPAGANLVLQNVAFIGCESFNFDFGGDRLGGAISWRAATGLVEIEGGSFIDNSVTNNNADSPTVRAAGGALYSRTAVEIDGTTFDANLALGHNPSGGAIEVDGAMLRIGPDTTFTGNAAGRSGEASGTAYGGAVSVRQGDVDVQGARMVSNAAWGSTEGRGGALAVQGVGGLVAIRDSRFDQNAALGAGGAVYLQCRSCTQCSGCEQTIERNTFDANRADFGAAVRIDSGDSAPVALARVVNNAFLRSQVDAERSAFGALSLRNANADIANNTFLEDDAQPLHPFDISALEVYSPLPTQLLLSNNLLGRRGDGTACYLLGDVAVQSAGNFGPDASCEAFQADIQDSTSLPDPVHVQQDILRIPTFPGSALVDGGTPTCIVNEDILGQARPTDGDGDGVVACDVGAYEHGFDGIFRDGFEGH